MTADILVNWAIRNDFVPVGEICFRGSRNGSRVSIEIKRASFVVISDGGGKSPSVVSKRFEDVRYDAANDIIVGIPALAAATAQEAPRQRRWG